MILRPNFPAKPSDRLNCLHAWPCPHCTEWKTNFWEIENTFSAPKALGFFFVPSKLMRVSTPHHLGFLFLGKHKRLNKQKSRSKLILICNYHRGLVKNADETCHKNNKKVKVAPIWPIRGDVEGSDHFLRKYLYSYDKQMRTHTNHNRHFNARYFGSQRRVDYLGDQGSGGYFVQIHFKSLLFSQNRFNCNDDHSGLISGIITTAGCPIWVGRTTWNTFQSEITYFFFFRQITFSIFISTSSLWCW